MYRYDEFDRSFVNARVAQFSDQVERRLAGEITEDQFKPLRLMNGVYLQLHAYMLRIAVPYGTLNGRQMRKLAHVARTYDKGYGHFTTRQNIQFNWPALSDIPAILEELASVEMHAIQTSGNCIRNVTADHFAGAAADEVADPRPYAEILRQWSSVHPEFSYLPRKFKIAVTGAGRDRAAIQVHDIGLHLKKDAGGRLGFAVYVGGGQGRTPMIAKKIRDFLPEEDLLSYTTAIVRVYNLHGRRDNKFKARIKILVHETGAEELTKQIEAEFAALRDGELKLPDKDIRAIETYFAPPPLTPRPEGDDAVRLARLDSKDFTDWLGQNVTTHKHADYAAVTISLKAIGEAPGDATDQQMEAVAALAEQYGFDEIRVSHEQNLVLPHVARADLKAVDDRLVETGLATANSNLISDI
ncbi:MAG: nitrite/sulfite reductase, partial [Nitratireductor sp.]